IIVLPDTEKMVDFANEYAPEHLIISMNSPWKIADKISAAGSVFIGNFSPESAGDYASGTNHTLPTSAWARSFSGVNIDSFMHKITYQELSQEGLEQLSSVITTMAHAEGLDAHALAVDVRLKK
ncbi:MAG: histidinol dehydrogenase, partial [Muribaculaceae bacterium]|nr:histidinol dehydrogenase [Muribaculaceae bacterium]